MMKDPENSSSQEPLSSLRLKGKRKESHPEPEKN
jgi:hypothetical protein